MLEGELPELFALVRVQLDMPARMLVTSAVSQPDVEARIGQHEGRSLVFVVDEPCIRRIHQAMLQQNGFESFDHLGVFLLDTEYPQNVAVLGGDIMDLDGVVEVPAVVGEFELGLGVLFGPCHHRQHEQC